MQDTAPTGGVTSSVPSTPSASAERGARRAADEGVDNDHAKVEVAVAPLERGRLRRGVVGDREQQDEAGAGQEAEDGAAHESTLRLSAGDVDLNGDVVNRLRPLCVYSSIDLDEHLLGVARMIAASKALELAKRGPAVLG
jgi:hypothetical protein